MFDYTYEDEKIEFNVKAMDMDAPQLPAVEDIEVFVPLIWAEHCLECTAPECYHTCGMYEADRYGRCKRTEYGIRTRTGGYPFPAVQLKYRKWGKLRCGLNDRYAYDPETFARKYRRYLHRKSAAAVLNRPLNSVPPKYKDVLIRAVHHEYIKKYGHGAARNARMGEELLLIFHADREFTLMLDTLDLDERLAARSSFSVKPGLNTWSIPMEKVLGGGAEVHALELYPHNNEPAEMIFYLSDIVTLRRDGAYYRKRQGDTPHGTPAAKVKCVIWDLDNTLWSGVIGDCGEENIVWNDKAVSVIRQLDERGVLQSICSKNDHDLAWGAVCRRGLDEYFLYPQINWKPKSTNIRRIEKSLNINADTFVLIDDSRTERQEIMTMIPNMRVYDDTAIDSLLSRPEFDLPVTEDSKNRRLYYMAEAKRNAAFEQEEEQDYKSFIRQCGFQVEVTRCTEKEDIDRCHELLQRTNQLNASTNRIGYDEFVFLAGGGTCTVLKVACRDCFGSYGTVGCLIVKREGGALRCTDFVLSCRIAKKKVESALVSFLMEKSGMDMEIVYYPTPRNRVLLDELVSVGGDYEEDRHIIRFAPTTIRDDDWVQVSGPQTLS